MSEKASRRNLREASAPKVGLAGQSRHLLHLLERLLLVSVVFSNRTLQDQGGVTDVVLSRDGAHDYLEQVMEAQS